MKISIDGVILPNKPLTNSEILDVVKKTRNKKLSWCVSTRRVTKKSLNKECNILNLDHAMGSGTHWTAWFKNNGKNYILTVLVFDRC